MTDLPLPFKPEMVRALLCEVQQPGSGKRQTRSLVGILHKFGEVA